MRAVVKCYVLRRFRDIVCSESLLFFSSFPVGTIGCMVFAAQFRPLPLPLPPLPSRLPRPRPRPRLPPRPPRRFWAALVECKEVSALRAGWHIMHPLSLCFVSTSCSMASFCESMTLASAVSSRPSADFSYCRSCNQTQYQQVNKQNVLVNTTHTVQHHGETRSSTLSNHCWIWLRSTSCPEAKKTTTCRAPHI